jgi:hypothetical protein
MAEEIFWAIFILGYATALAIKDDGSGLAALIVAAVTTAFTIGYAIYRFIAWRRDKKRNQW